VKIVMVENSVGCHMNYDITTVDCGGLCRKSHELDTGGDIFILNNSKNCNCVEISISWILQESENIFLMWRELYEGNSYLFPLPFP
jgi:hypothetical protein